MREFLLSLKQSLEEVCPTYVHVPPRAHYPYITLEPEIFLQGVPWGPLIVRLQVKIWSHYLGTQEVLQFAHQVEEALESYPSASLKILKSVLVLLKDGKTRLHTFDVKARIKRGMK